MEFPLLGKKRVVVLGISIVVSLILLVAPSTTPAQSATKATNQDLITPISPQPTSTLSAITQAVIASIKKFTITTPVVTRCLNGEVVSLSLKNKKAGQMIVSYARGKKIAYQKVSITKEQYDNALGRSVQPGSSVKICTEGRFTDTASIRLAGTIKNRAPQGQESTFGNVNGGSSAGAGSDSSIPSDTSETTPEIALAPDVIFGSNLVGWYGPDSMYQDAGKTVPATASGEAVAVWADKSATHNDLDVSISNYTASLAPGPFVNSGQLAGYPVFGSGWIYDYTDGTQITQSGDPTVNGIFNGFIGDGLDYLSDYTVFFVSKNSIDDNPLFLFTNLDQTESRSIYTSDHHTLTGNVLYSLAGSDTIAYKGPNGDNAYHKDGTWRIIATPLSWARANVALWVNGTKYVGSSLPVQSSVDTGANVLIPTDSDTVTQFNDSIPQAEILIIHGIPSDADMLQAFNYFSSKYNIALDE